MSASKAIGKQFGDYLSIENKWAHVDIIHEDTRTYALHGDVIKGVPMYHLDAESALRAAMACLEAYEQGRAS